MFPFFQVGPVKGKIRCIVWFEATMINIARERGLDPEEDFIKTQIEGSAKAFELIQRLQFVDTGQQIRAFIAVASDDIRGSLVQKFESERFFCAQNREKDFIRKATSGGNLSTPFCC